MIWLHQRCDVICAGLYNKGLIYLIIPISDRDTIVVPPLQVRCLAPLSQRVCTTVHNCFHGIPVQGFVMNRVQGDYFETLLYKIFVSIDEYTDMKELSSVLQIDLEQIKVGHMTQVMSAVTVCFSQNAVSLFIRLGFAHKKATPTDPTHHHSSWNNAPSSPLTTPTATPLTLETPGSDSEQALGKRSPSPGDSPLCYWCVSQCPPLCYWCVSQCPLVDSLCVTGVSLNVP